MIALLPSSGTEMSIFGVLAHGLIMHMQIITVVCMQSAVYPQSAFNPGLQAAFYADQFQFNWQQSGSEI